MASMSKMQLVGLALAGSAVGASAQVAANAGLMIKTPDGSTWNDLRDTNDSNLAKWSFTDDAGTPVGTVESCFTGVEFRNSLENFYLNGGNVSMDEQLECALRERVRLLPEYCGASFMAETGGMCNPALLVYSEDVVRDIGQDVPFPEHNVRFVKQSEMQKPLPYMYEMTHHHFHLGQPLFEVEVTAVNEQSKPHQAFVGVQSDKAAQAFLLVTEEPMVPASSSSGNCEDDCSCARRYIRDKWFQTKQRRRLQNPTEDESTETPTEGQATATPTEGQATATPTSTPADATTAPTVSDRTDMPTSSMPVPPDGESELCQSEMEACQTSSDNCSTVMNLFMDYYNDTSRLGQVEEWLQNSQNPPTDPLYTLFSCHYQIMRQRTIDIKNQKGEPVDASYCQAEFESCLGESSGECRKKLLVEASFNSYDREILMPIVGNNENAEALFQQVIGCTPLNMEHDHYDSGFDLLAVPVSSIPCACGGGNAFVYQREGYGLDNVYGITTAVDTCFVDQEMLGTIQFQYTSLNDTFIGGQMFSTPEFNLESQVMSGVVSCMTSTANECTPEQTLIKERLINATTPRVYQPPSAACGYEARYLNESWGNNGNFDGCPPLHVDVKLVDLLAAYNEENDGFPSIDIRPFSSYGNDDIMMDSVMKMEISSTSDQLSRVSLSMDFHSNLKSYTELQYRPDTFASSQDGTTGGFELDESNCHLSCGCDKVYLARYWDDHNKNMEGGSSPLLVPDQDIPCACSEWSSKEFNKVHSENRNHMYGYMTSVMEYCSMGVRVLKSDYHYEPTLRKWTWLCDCEASMGFDYCLNECHMARGEWAWTCDGNADMGFQQIDLLSEDAKQMRDSMCYDNYNGGDDKYGSGDGNSTP